MPENTTFLAVFLGSKTGPKMAAWMALPKAERKAKEKGGHCGVESLGQRHQGSVASIGGPLGQDEESVGKRDRGYQ